MSTNKSSSYMQVTLNRVDNTETVSSPHTYAHSGGGSDAQMGKNNVPATTLLDRPQISNLLITSAMVGLPIASLENGKWRKQPNIVAPSSPEVAQVKLEDMVGKGGALGCFASQGLTSEGFPRTTRRVEKLSFDMDAVSPPIANLFRRVITTEVPTLAFDRVLLYENDGVVLDELLSHRLGLVPVAGPVSLMEYITESSQASFQSLDPKRVLLFELEAEAEKNVAVTPVYSGQLRWVPLPGQEGFQQRPNDLSATQDDEDNQVFVVHPDILLTKLGPGQRLKLRAMAVKGIGAVHTKWSPVSACYYEMKTSIELTEPVVGKAAEELVKMCPKGVFGLVKVPKEDMEDEEEDAKLRVGLSKDSEELSTKPVSVSAIVLDGNKCTISRECLRTDLYPELENKVKIQKNKTSVRFHIESVGQLRSVQIFRTALTLFAERVRYLAQVIQDTEVTGTVLE
ncbi:unnamed protein product [Phytomonas sp. EM1]|nr:unnamed protein product [Phytomonas sp. EM1]|eukprot:CCW60788.1 unnamed protein product [Phytomonas sp. isolate EM1]